MNLPNFLKEADSLSKRLSHEELEKFIHEVGRTLSETKRESFIKTLKTIGGLATEDKMHDIGGSGDDGYTKLSEDYQALKDKLIQINEGTFCLNSEYNQEWDDWYNSDADEILFSDPQGILDFINEAMALIHICVDTEGYKAGCELAETLSVLEITAEGDYYGSPLQMHDLFDCDLLKYDFNSFVRECLYLAYMGNVHEDRADELFCMMNNFQCNDICLEDILQSGNHELPQFQEFLPLWISYLGMIKGRRAEKLLQEAQMMVQDDAILLENARKFADVHPALYEQLLRMKLTSSEDVKMLEIGKEALDTIPASYIIRSDIALITAEYADKLKDCEEAERCWLEAFRSSSTVVNYLRVRFQSRDWSKHSETVKHIYERIYSEANKSSSYDRDAQKENRISKNEYCVMLFFDEQFDRLLTIGMNENEGIGWSGTFMKQGLALVLLLLYRGTELPKGLTSMLGTVTCACEFQTVDYCKGTGNNSGLSDKELLWNLLKQWKDHVQVSDSETKKWLDKMDQWVALRVTGIMDGNHRNYYGECASYIAALGEVLESLGIPAAKSQIMERYRSKYSRRRAFHQELRVYGMIK